MPNADEQVLIKGVGVDNLKVQEFTEKVFQSVSGAERVEVSSSIGTSLSFTLDPQRQWLVFGSVLRKNGWTNLPGAEVAVCPEDAQGTAVIDGVIGDFFVKYGCVRETPLTLKLEKSRVVHAECKNVSLESELRAYLRTDEASNRVGELAFGTNQFLEGFSGKMIIDEKFPTVHFAAGHPYVAEGEEPPFDSKTHVDFVMKSVTAKVDGRTILEDGSYKI
jgi:leucyl aminopeptidase (aminopeptidase T)